MPEMELKQIVEIVYGMRWFTEFEECDGCGLVSTESNLEVGSYSSLTESGQKMR